MIGSIYPLAIGSNPLLKLHQGDSMIGSIYPLAIGSKPPVGGAVSPFCFPLKMSCCSDKQRDFSTLLDIDRYWLLQARLFLKLRVN